jgi:hypothetical protein
MGAPAVEQLHIEEYRRLLELMWPEGLSIPRDSWHVFLCALSCKNTKKKERKKGTLSGNDNIECFRLARPFDYPLRVFVVEENSMSIGPWV